MKKSELTQLTQIIEHLVAREVRKQLPTIIAETFQNMMGGKKVVSEERQPTSPQVIREQAEEGEEINLKASLRELFAGTPVMKSQPESPRQPRQYTKDPRLNQILNETVSDLRQRESMVGMAAFQGGYSPSVALAAEAMANSSGVSRQPVSLMEGQESNYAPMSEIPEGISALDVARQVPLKAPVAQALTRNYSQMMKLIDKKKGRA